MSLSPIQPKESEVARPLVTVRPEVGGAIGWTGLLFAILQSVCSFFVALSGLRLALGIGSLALSASTASAIDAFHTNWIRFPMLTIALAGALLNLTVVFQIRRLRRRPAAQWRQVPPASKTLRMERLQLLLACATLVIIAIEEYVHFGLFRSM
jgi:ABC-type xylose transport system permease subunit